MAWLCGRSKTLSCRVAASLQVLRVPHPAFAVPQFPSRSLHFCVNSSSLPDCDLASAELVRTQRLIQQDAHPSLKPDLKTTYEGIDDGMSERLDSQRLQKLSHNSYGFSRASFVAAHRKPGLEENYMLSAVLGRGATATVYRSICYQTCQKVAVKAIQKRFVPNARRRLNEIQIHRAMDHPNILRLLDTFEDDKMLYLVTELCEGGNLRDYINADGIDEGSLAMSEGDALQLFRQMVSSVHYLHQRGIVHRDLKPGNFLCDGRPMQSPATEKNPNQETTRPIVKLADFGVSAYCGEEKHLLTRSVGSDGFIAPEVISRQPYTEKADIFSLGCILHTMLTGSTPECRDGVFTLDESMLQTSSEEVRSLLRSLTQHSPADRPSTEAVLQSSLLKPDMKTEAQVPDHIMERISAYGSFPLLKRAALTAMISQTTSDVEFVDARDKFVSICSSASMSSQGRPGLSLHAVHHKPQQQRPGLSGCRLQSKRPGLKLEPWLMRNIDTSGAVSFSEWLAATVDAAWYTDASRISSVFQLFDLDQDGFISEGDLRRLLPDVFERLPVDIVLQGTQITAWQTAGIDQEQFAAFIRTTDTGNQLDCYREGL